MSQPDLYPSGLAPQRTVLAWRRTLIGLLVGSVVSQRLMAPALGAWSFALAGTGLLLTALIWLLAERRSRRTASAWTAVAPGPGGALLLLLSALVTGIAVIAVTYVVGRFVLG